MMDQKNEKLNVLLALKFNLLVSGDSLGLIHNFKRLHIRGLHAGKHSLCM